MVSGVTCNRQLTVYGEQALLSPPCSPLGITAGELVGIPFQSAIAAKIIIGENNRRHK